MYSTISFCKFIFKEVIIFFMTCWPQGQHNIYLVVFKFNNLNTFLCIKYAYTVGSYKQVWSILFKHSSFWNYVLMAYRKRKINFDFIYFIVLFIYIYLNYDWKTVFFIFLNFNSSKTILNNILYFHLPIIKCLTVLKM